MATMNVSLPDEMKALVEGEVKTGRFSNASDYVRDLIRRDLEEHRFLESLRASYEDGLESGLTDQTFDEIVEDARRAAASADAA